MATYKDLQEEVDRLNAKYCKHTKNELRVDRAYGGYTVYLVGKKNKKTGELLKGAMQGASNVGNQYHSTATDMLNGLYKSEARGWLKSDIRYREKHK